MTIDVDRLLALWEQPLSSRADAEADFREFYTDPTVINGVEMPVSALVARAAAVQEAFPLRRTELLQRVETPDHLVIAFVMRARHEGVYQTPLGPLPPTGRDVAIRTIDILTIRDGRIANVWVNADELGMLLQVEAVELHQRSLADHG